MMMNLFKQIPDTTSRWALPLAAVLLLLGAAACSDVLDTTPTDRFTEEAVWNDPALVDAFIAQTYRSIPTGFLYSFYNLGNVTDELNARNNSWAWGANANGIPPDNLSFVDFWTDVRSGSAVNRSYWKPINLVNEFLEKIDETEFEDPDMKARRIAEMRTIRAKSYFHLANLFGDVPLIENTFSLDDDFAQTRDSYDDVMQFVVDELDAAIPDLPLPSEMSNSEKGHMSKGAAMGLKSRALLYWASPLNNPDDDMTRWEDARDAAWDVIQLGEYDLFDDYRTAFLEENIYNEEMLWQRPFNQLVSFEQVYVELSSYPNGYNGFGQIHPIQNLVDDFETTNGLKPEDDPAYDDQDPYSDRDPRFYATILHDGLEWKGREVETFLPGGLDSNEGPVSAWNATQTGYYSRKFVNERIDDPSGSNMSQTPWPFQRYAEILLNYAEAQYNLGEEGIAREYLNMVRSRPSVDMPDVTESGDDLFDRIVNERRIELVFEQHRWYDLRRWMIAPDVLNEDQTRMKITKLSDGTKEYEVDFWKEANFQAPRDYRLPVPQSELDKNADLGQNPGYN
ncbi:MAG: RagB/SusD family nutrient uptake outer membrane protein [Bacteroidota bacterium]